MLTKKKKSSLKSKRNSLNNAECTFKEADAISVICEGGLLSRKNVLMLLEFSQVYFLFLP